jgi:hypothetical protein
VAHLSGGPSPIYTPSGDVPCRIPAFVKLAKTVKANRERILAAVELGLSNSKLEGLNSKVRLINHRGYGHHSAAALIAMVCVLWRHHRRATDSACSPVVEMTPRKPEENLSMAKLRSPLVAT